MALISGNGFTGDLDLQMVTGGMYGGYEPQSVGVAATIVLECPDPDGFFKDVIVSTSANRIVASIHKSSNPIESYLAFYDPLTLQPVGVGTTVVPNGSPSYEFKFDNLQQHTYEEKKVNTQIINTFNPRALSDKIVALCEDAEGVVYVAFFDLDGNIKKVWKPKAYGTIFDYPDPATTLPWTRGQYGPITTGSKYGSVQMVASTGMIAIGRTTDQAINYDNGTTQHTFTGDGIFVFKVGFPVEWYGPRYMNNIPPPYNSVADFFPNHMVMDGNHIVATAKGGGNGPHGDGAYVRIHDVHGNLRCHIGQYGESGTGYFDLNKYTDVFNGQTSISQATSIPIVKIDSTHYFKSTSDSNVYGNHNWNVDAIGGVAIASGKIAVSVKTAGDNRGMIHLWDLNKDTAVRYNPLSVYADHTVKRESYFSTLGDYMGTDIHMGSGRIVWGSPTATHKTYDAGFDSSANNGDIEFWSTDYDKLDGYSVFGNGFDPEIGVLKQLRVANSYWTVKDIRAGVVVLCTDPPLGSGSGSASKIKILRTPDSVHILDILEQK